MFHSTLARRVRGILGLLAAGTVLVALAASCGRNMTGPRDRVPMTLRAAAAGPGMTARNARAADDTVTYSQVLLVVREVRFRLADTTRAGEGDGEDDIRPAAFAHLAGDSMGGHEGEGDDDHEADDDHVESVAFRGPFVVDLLAQSAESLDTEMVPPGTYHSAQGSIGPLKASDWNASKFSFLIGSTVYLKGTVKGEGGGDFTYLAPISHTFTIRGPFVVQANTPATAFLTFDISRWLRSPTGAFLDPRDPANSAAIQEAIIRSIRAGMDDNHDGRCDDRTHGEDD
jgi:hypothetical protein